MPSRRSVAVALGLGLAASALTFTPATAAAVVDNTIAEIQGTGAASPVAGSADLYRTRGVVTASYPTGGFDGFYMQTEGTGLGSDATPGASDGIFVWRGSGGSFTYPEVGDFVEVVGKVTEGGGPALNLTQLVPGADGSVTALTEAHDPVTELQTNYPTTTAEREAHEGELLASRPAVHRERQLPHQPLRRDRPRHRDRPADPADRRRPARHARGGRGRGRQRGVAQSRSTTVRASTTRAPTKNEPLPWLSRTNPIRVGADRRRTPAGDPRLPQQHLEAPADLAGDRWRRRRRQVRRTPGPGRRRQWAVTCGSPPSTC